MNVLDSLIRLGQRERVNLALHSGGKDKHIALRLSDDGRIASAELVEDSPIRYPWPFSRSSGVVPNLLWDNEKYLFGKDKHAKHREAAKLFHEELLALARRNRGAKAVAAFFDRRQGLTKQLQALIKKGKGASFVFYREKGKRPICEDPGLYDAINQVLRDRYETATRPPLFGDSSEVLLSVHPKIWMPGLPADKPKALVTYNSDTSWITARDSGRMLHAPMSYDTMRYYTGGLEWLVRRGRLPIPRTRGSTVSHYLWAEDPHPIDDLAVHVLRGCPKGTEFAEWREQISSRLDAIRGDEVPVHILHVSCSTRIVVRGFHTVPAGKLAESLRTYLDDFSFVSKDGPQWAWVRPFTILAQATKHTNEATDEMPQGLVERFYDAVLLGHRYPSQLLVPTIRLYLKAQVRDGASDILHKSTLNAITRREGHDMSEEFQNTNPHAIGGRIFGRFEIRNVRAKDPADQARMTRLLESCCKNPARNLAHAALKSETHRLKLMSRGHRTMQEELSALWDRLEDLGGIPSGCSTGEQQLYFLRGRQYEWRLYREELARLKEEKAKREEGEPEKGEEPDEGDDSDDEAGC